ncbi:neutral zinc metallopeptidase [Pseudomonas purpurea]|uniref:KPN_02809 family neutral zinc metallopeptidase n=1 Tax=Pseudomonas purpurea TaxID=3136737 RepID=UPI003263CB56
MLWNKARRSDHVLDTRESSSPRSGINRKIAAGMGIAALAAIGLLGKDLLPHDTPEDDRSRAFVESILGDTEEAWTQLLEPLGQAYPNPSLTLFDNGVVSGCGFASSAIGPFYCTADQQIFLDLTFFDEMARQYSVVGDFAQAYIIAHEVGHHVQNVLGLTKPLDDALDARQSVDGDGGLHVRGELQADCLAGVWAQHAQQRLNWLEPGDIEAALHAATVFGDDYLQRNQTAALLPETFTHGTSAQRMHWFNVGFTQGRLDQCDTFAAEPL